MLALRKQRRFKCFSGSVEGRDKAALTSTCEKMEGSTGGVGAPREALCELRFAAVEGWRGGRPEKRLPKSHHQTGSWKDKGERGGLGKIFQTQEGRRNLCEILRFEDLWCLKNSISGAIDDEVGDSGDTEQRPQGEWVTELKARALNRTKEGGSPCRTPASRLFHQRQRFTQTSTYMSFSGGSCWNALCHSRFEDEPEMLHM